jgi:superfamily II DNA/RNA helicase
MDASIIENTSDVWQDQYAKASYASEAIVHIMSSEGFSSADVRMLFETRGGFILRTHRSKDSHSPEERRLLGTVLNKLALRGGPAPCSLKVERYILQKAKDAGLLVYDESNTNGKIKFSCTPLINDFELVLRVCCIPELLIPNNEVSLLLQYYESLLGDSKTKKQFFNKLISVLPNSRLALFVVPACLFDKDFVKKILKSEDQIDFVIQVPNLRTKKPLRIAISLGESLRRSDERDGWIVKQFGQMKRQYWESEVRKLADQISYALQGDILAAAKQLRELPLEKKKAIEELISLPIAEAQLTQAIANLIYSSGRAKIVIGNPQKLNLAVVLEAVRDMIYTLSSLYNIKSPVELLLAEDDNLEPDIEYFSLPERSAFSFSSIIPQPLCLYRDSNRPEANSRPIKRGSSAALRNSLRFMLNNVFRCKDFLEDQAELVERMLSLSGSISLLRPGGGKTLAYQLAGILQPGVTLVGVPNRYVALDQKYSLSARGIHRTNAVLMAEEELQQNTKDLTEQEADFLFLTEDLLQDHGSKAYLNEIFSAHVNFLVFDEAQALSEWNCGFQVGYLNLVRWARHNCALNGSNPSIIALASTNSRFVLLDLMNELDLNNLYYIMESASYDRKNLQYEIHKVNTRNRMQVLISILRATLRRYGRNAGPSKIPSGLIICSLEDEEDTSLNSLCKSLKQYLNIPVGVCSLKPQKKSLRLGGVKEVDEEDSHNELRQFKMDELPVLVCSSEAAMGLNRDDIRFTLHTDKPASLEEFFSQSGQAGQDGEQSSCIIFFPEGSEYPIHEEAFDRIEHERNEKQIDDEFPGRVIERRILSLAISKLFPQTSSHNIGEKVDSEILISSFPDRLFLKNGNSRVPLELKRRLLEKALYRLLLLGAIEGYKKGLASFKVRVILAEASYIYMNYRNYINRYAIERQAYSYLPKKIASSYISAVMKCGCRLVDYSYDRIKINKANDAAKMLQAVELGQSAIGKFRDCLLESVEQSGTMARLTDAVASESWWSILEEIKGLDEFLALFLACRRTLKLHPDDPRVHIIAGFCALAFPNAGQEYNELMKGFCNLKNSTTNQYRLDVAQRIISCAELLMPSKRDSVLESIWQADSSLEIARLCYEQSEFADELHYSSLFKLANGLIEALKGEGV